MKNAKTLIFGALAIGSSAVYAQSSVTIYGIVDTGVEYVSNVGAAKQGLVRMPNLTGTTPSRIGFRGIEDLGNGLKGIFMLENGFAPDSGALNQGGRLFGRVQSKELPEKEGKMHKAR